MRVYAFSIWSNAICETAGLILCLMIYIFCVHPHNIMHRNVHSLSCSRSFAHKPDALLNNYSLVRKFLHKIPYKKRRPGLIKRDVHNNNSLITHPIITCELSVSIDGSVAFATLRYCDIATLRLCDFPYFMALFLLYLVQCFRFRF